MRPSTEPLPTVAEPIAAIFHVRTSAPLLAVSGMITSACPSGIATELGEPTPGGLYSMYTEIGAVKSFLTSCLDLQPHRPVAHDRHLGLHDLDREGDRLGHRHGQPVGHVRPDVNIVLPANQRRHLLDVSFDVLIRIHVACPRRRPIGRRAGHRPRR